MDHGETPTLSTPLKNREQITQAIAEEQHREKQELRERLQREKQEDSEKLGETRNKIPESHRLVHDYTRNRSKNTPTIESNETSGKVDQTETPVIESISPEVPSAFFQPSPKNDGKFRELFNGNPDFVRNNEILNQLKALDPTSSATDEQRQAAQKLLNTEYDKFLMGGTSAPNKNETGQPSTTTTPDVEVPRTEPNPHWKETVRTGLKGGEKIEKDPEELAKELRIQHVLRTKNFQSERYREVLGVPPDATDSHIYEAFRALVKVTHPDTSQDPNKDPRNFHKVTEAYKGLKKGLEEPVQETSNRGTPSSQQAEPTQNTRQTEQQFTRERSQGTHQKQPEKPVEPSEYGRVKNEIDASIRERNLPSISSLMRLAVTVPQRNELIGMIQRKRTAFIMTDIDAVTNDYQLVSITSLKRSAKQNEIDSQDLAKLLQAVQKKRFNLLISEIVTAQKSYKLPSLDSVERSFQQGEINEQQSNAIKEKIRTKYYQDAYNTILTAQTSYKLPSLLFVETQFRNGQINQAQLTELISVLREKNFQFLMSEIANAARSWSLPDLRAFDSMAQRGEITSRQVSELTSELNAKKRALS